MLKLAKLEEVDNYNYNYDVFLAKMTRITKDTKEVYDALSLEINTQINNIDLDLEFNTDISITKLEELNELKSIWKREDFLGAYGLFSYGNDKNNDILINNIIISRYFKTKYLINIDFTIELENEIIYSGSLEFEFDINELKKDN